MSVCARHFCLSLCLFVCARFGCGARARVPDNNATKGLGVAFGAGGAWVGDHSLGGGGNATDVDGAAKAVEILTRSMRQLVTFCPDELLEAFANHFSKDKSWRCWQG